MVSRQHAPRARTTKLVWPLLYFLAATLFNAALLQLREIRLG